MTAVTDSATALAMSITDRPYISWTQVTTYQSCPRAFAFRYVDKADPEFTPSSLIFGGGIHQAISLVNESQLEGNETPNIEMLMEFFRESLDTRGPPIRFGASEDLDSLISLGERMLKAFLVSDAVHPDGEIICIEEAVRGSIDPDLPDIDGKIDLVTLTHEGATVTDYKTTRNAWTQAKVEEHAGQLRLYAELVADRIFGDQPKPVSTQFVTITKAKTPKVVVLPASPDDAKTEATKQQLRDVWSGIATGVFPARPGWPCKSCPFQSRCDAAAV